MRTIKRTARFKKDYKREAKGQHGKTLDADLMPPFHFWPRMNLYRKNSVTILWRANGNHRDCHIRPDLVLIYRVPDAESLELVRLGSHSELSL